MHEEAKIEKFKIEERKKSLKEIKKYLKQKQFKRRSEQLKIKLANELKSVPEIKGKNQKFI